jgi:hypothetical protein
MLENFPEENKRLKCFFKKMGDLFTLEDKYYHITSAYAHEVLFDARRKGAHIAMIMYPSVACNHNGINLAIHPSFVDGKLMSLNKVIKLKITRIDESSIEVSVMEKGNPKENSTIEWKKPTISIETIHYEEINMGTYNDQTFQGENALSLSINKKSKKFGDHIKSVIDKMNLIDCLLQIPFKDDVIEFEFARRKYLMILQYNKGIQVKIDGRYDDVKYIALPITYTDDYR